MTYHITRNKYLVAEELELLEANLKHFADANPRDVALLFTALKTGARATEVLNLRPQDLINDTLYIRGIKGSANREIPIARWLVKMLRAQISPTSDRIFPISYNRLRQIWQLYRPVKKKLHSLRHTFAINLYKKTKDPRLVQVALGHINFKNTAVYMQYEYSSTELRKAIL